MTITPLVSYSTSSAIPSVAGTLEPSQQVSDAVYLYQMKVASMPKDSVSLQAQFAQLSFSVKTGASEALEDETSRFIEFINGPLHSSEQTKKEKFIAYVKNGVNSLSTMNTPRKKVVLKTIEKTAVGFEWTSKEWEDMDADLSLFLISCFSEQKPIPDLYERVHALQTSLKQRLKKLPVQYQSLLLRCEHGDYFFEKLKISQALFDMLMQNVPEQTPLVIAFDKIDKDTFDMLSALLETGEATTVDREKCPPMFFGMALHYNLEDTIPVYFQLFIEQLRELYEAKISVEQAIKTRGVFDWIDLPEWTRSMIYNFESNAAFFSTKNATLLAYKKEIEQTIFYMKVKRLNEKSFLKNLESVTDTWPKELVAWATLRVRYFGKEGVSFYTKIPEALLKLPSAAVFVKAYEKAVKEAQEVEASKKLASFKFNTLERVAQLYVEGLSS